MFILGLVRAALSPTTILYAVVFAVLVYVLGPVGIKLYNGWNAEAREISELKHTVGLEVAARAAAERQLDITRATLDNATKALTQAKDHQRELSRALEKSSTFETALRKEASTLRNRIDRHIKELQTCEQLVATVTRELSTIGKSTTGTQDRKSP